MTFVPGGKKFFNRYLARGFLQSLDPINRPVDFSLPLVRFRHEPGNGAPMTRNHNCLPLLDLVEKLGEVGFGFRSLDAHFSTSQIDQSIVARSAVTVYPRVGDESAG